MADRGEGSVALWLCQPLWLRGLAGSCTEHSSAPPPLPGQCQQTNHANHANLVRLSTTCHQTHHVSSGDDPHRALQLRHPHPVVIPFHDERTKSTLCCRAEGMPRRSTFSSAAITSTSGTRGRLSTACAVWEEKDQKQCLRQVLVTVLTLLSCSPFPPALATSVLSLRSIPFVCIDHCQSPGQTATPDGSARHIQLGR